MHLEYLLEYATIYTIYYIHLYIIKHFNVRFINYLEDEHLQQFSSPTSSVSERIYHILHLLLSY